MAQHLCYNPWPGAACSFTPYPRISISSSKIIAISSFNARTDKLSPKTADFPYLSQMLWVRFNVSSLVSHGVDLKHDQSRRFPLNRASACLHSCCILFPSTASYQNDGRRPAPLGHRCLFGRQQERCHHDSPFAPRHEDIRASK